VQNEERLSHSETTHFLFTPISHSNYAKNALKIFLGYCYVFVE